MGKTLYIVSLCISYACGLNKTCNIFYMGLTAFEQCLLNNLQYWFQEASPLDEYAWQYIVIINNWQVLEDSQNEERHGSEKINEDENLALTPPQPEMDKKVTYNSELPRCLSWT